MENNNLGPYISKRKWPVNLNNKDKWLFEHELQKEIPAYAVKVFTNGHVNYHASVYNDQTFFEESFTDPTKKRNIEYEKHYRSLIKKTHYCKGKALWIAEHVSRGYYHWICDSLPRLYQLKNLIDESVLILHDYFLHAEYIRTSLKLFGVKDILPISHFEEVQADKLYFSPYTAPVGNFRDPLIYDVREYILSKLSDLPSPKYTVEKIYISRTKTGKRIIKNEDELLPILKKYDFEIYTLEDMNWINQVNLFSNAKYVVTNHGAGLTNILFMPSGSSVLELRNAYDNKNNCFYALANAVGHLDYYYQLCNPVDANEDPHTADVNVSPQQLEKDIQKLLSSQ